MTPEAWEKISQLFEEASALPPDQRVAFLNDLGKKNAAWKQEVESLLHFERSDRDFLEKSIPAQSWHILAEPPHSIFSPGDKISDFYIERKLGSGSFGSVYLAREISLHRLVALKVSENRGEEGRTMAILEHDNIVRVFSETVDPASGLRLICMQYVDGETLRENAMYTQTDKILQLGMQLANALAHAHEKGVIHLDVKPENILIGSGSRPFLTDFNISANRRSANRKLYGGTFRYMAPEQQRALESGKESAFHKLDERADIYALGIVLGELFELAEDRHVHGDFKRLLDQCTCEAPEDRVGSAHELVLLLSGYAELQLISQKLPDESLYTRWVRRFPTVALFLSILVPQLVGTVVNISYNAMRIVSHLSEAQQKTFHKLLFILNPITYGTCLMIILPVILPLIRLRSKIPSAALRKRVLLAPLWIALITTFGWMSSAIAFPLLIHLWGGPLTKEIVGHFWVSFALSWLVAMTYSFLAMQYLGLRIFYPALWTGAAHIRRTAHSELSWYFPRVRVFPFFAGFIPIVAACLMVLVGPESLHTASYEVYRFLLSLLLVMAMLGLAYALVATRQLSEIFLAFTE